MMISFAGIINLATTSLIMRKLPMNNPKLYVGYRYAAQKKS